MANHFDLRGMAKDPDLIQSRVTETKILLLQGKTLKEIADLLGYSCEQALQRMMKKAGIRCPNKSGPRKVRKGLTYDQAVEILKKKRMIGN